MVSRALGLFIFCSLHFSKIVYFALPTRLGHLIQLLVPLRILPCCISYPSPVGMSITSICIWYSVYVLPSNEVSLGLLKLYFYRFSLCRILGVVALNVNLSFALF